MFQKKNQRTNRLIDQKSPYLLQHAHNPVDWYPWGEEAFSLAKEQNKPIFLSIGYATCHWCHVMGRESFENAEIANLMNEAFINIKVDREELPEVDSIYMEMAQSLMTGTAGWPLNLLLSPNLSPFFAATYLPPHNAHGMMGMEELIERIENLWDSDEREQLITQSEKIVEMFHNAIEAKGSELPNKEMIEDTADLIFNLTDSVYGGMKGAPKFPIGYQYSFLLNNYSLRKEARALFVVEKTLEMMHRGGIYDHLGGGFSRYSVDEKWMVPHFEKMLYDNALLARAYLQTWSVTKNNFYKNICKEVLDYILRDMTDPKGGFYSAEDADSEGHEGFFYTWTLNEIFELLGREEASLFSLYYDVSEKGNFEGRNILHTPVPLGEFAKKNQIPANELEQRFLSQRDILWRAREKRPRPFKDDKILSSWNGLTISVLISAGTAFSETRYIDAAVKAAKFIEENMVVEGRLMRRWRAGEARFNAGLDDYACLIQAYILLFEAGCGSEWLEKAIYYATLLKDLYKESEGAFYQTDGSDENLILRKCQFSDGAEPSGNAVHTENLLKLYQITFSDAFLEQAEDVLKAVRKYIDNYPPGYCYHAMNLLRYYDKRAPTLVIALNASQEGCSELAKLIFNLSTPHKAVIWRHFEDEQLIAMIPSMKEYIPLEGKTTLYLCYRGVCQKPINDFTEIQRILSGLDV